MSGEGECGNCGYVINEGICFCNRRGMHREPSQDVSQIELLGTQQLKIDKLRGQLQNCVNYLERAKRKHQHDGGNYCIAIETANKCLYETLTS